MNGFVILALVALSLLLSTLFFIFVSEAINQWQEDR